MFNSIGGLKKLGFFFLLLFCCSSLLLAKQLTIKEARCDFKYNKNYKGEVIPQFSWKLTSSNRDVFQTAYKLVVAESKKDLSSSNKSVWTSTKQRSSQSVHIPYQGPQLKSKQTYYWQVEVWDNKGNSSKSEVMEWTTGLRSDEWSGEWIEAKNNGVEEQVVFFRKDFLIDKPIKQATLYITSKGIYEAELNNKIIGDQLMTPGWTTYPKRHQYQQFEVGNLLKKGPNSLIVGVAEGWYKGPLLAAHHLYGDKVALLSQLELTYYDGTTERIDTDQSWFSTNHGPVVRSGLYSGEIYDARKIKNLNTSFDKSIWESVNLSNQQDKTPLVSSIAPAVKRQEVLKPQRILISPRGEKIIDFGQNMIGRIRFNVTGNVGDSILFSHAEVLDHEGNFYTKNLRSAQQKIKYYLKGETSEFYEPVFTFQGFRYVRVEGNAELINTENIEAVVIHSDLPLTGKFITSNPLINQLQHNIVWGQKSNFLEVPTDCPQRDERLGWTGDAQVFFNTSTFNMDVTAFFTKWLADLRAEQLDNGGVPGVIPNIWGTGENNIGQAGWADAATIIPWNYYKAYGDSSVLKESYYSMGQWIEYINSRSTDNLWNKSWHHGDWLHYMPRNVWDHAPAYTDKTVIAQSFYANTVQNMINAAVVLEEKEDVKRYTELLTKIKKRFVDEFVTPEGAIMSNTQTAYVLALHFDLLPKELINSAVNRLVHLIHEYGVHLSTGFLGTPYLCHVLSRYGHKDLAYQLLLQESYPSWLYPVKKGATTIWERWDGIREDGSFQDEAMNSFNHYAYGAIGDWMYKNIGGINQAPESIGYKNTIIAPKLGGGFSFCNCELESVYGKVQSFWEIEDKKMKLIVEIPVNTTATIIFPDERVSGVFEKEKEVLAKDAEGKLLVGSGKYEFLFNVE